MSRCQIQTYNKTNQADPFFVRCAHKKGSAYLQRYVSKMDVI